MFPCLPSVCATWSLDSDRSINSWIVGSTQILAPVLARGVRGSGGGGGAAIIAEGDDAEELIIIVVSTFCL